MDETGFRVGCVQGHWVWTFDDIESPLLSDPGDRQLVTVLESISASGQVIPPYIILPGVEISAKFCRNNLDPRAKLDARPTGYTDDQLALQWLEHFDKHTRPKLSNQWRMLIIDGHGSHATEEFKQRCIELKISLNILPPHATHRLQPLDVGMFSVYKHWHQEAIVASIANGNFEFAKDDFLAALQVIRERTFKKHTILRAWELCGIYPYNPDIVLDALPDPLSASGDQDALDHHPTRPREGTPLSSTGSIPSAPKTPGGSKQEWQDIATPALKIRVIERYDYYINYRISAAAKSLDSPKYRCISPTLSHVVAKRTKASRVFELNGLKIEEELRKIRKASQEKAARRSSNKVLQRYGPIEVEEGELRLAQIDTEREAKRAAEEKRVAKKERQTERNSLSTWITAVQGCLRSSADNWYPQAITAESRKQGLVNDGGEATAETQRSRLDSFRERINDLETLTRHYLTQRQLRERFFKREVYLAKTARMGDNYRAQKAGADEAAAAAADL